MSRKLRHLPVYNSVRAGVVWCVRARAGVMYVFFDHIPLCYWTVVYQQFTKKKYTTRSLLLGQSIQFSKHLNNMKALYLLRLGLLGKEHSLNVWQHATLCNGDSGEKLIELLVVTDGQLQVTWDDASLLVVAGSVASKLKDFSSQLLPGTRGHRHPHAQRSCPSVGGDESCRPGTGVQRDFDFPFTFPPLPRPDMMMTGVLGDKWGASTLTSSPALWASCGENATLTLLNSEIRSAQWTSRPIRTLAEVATPDPDPDRSYIGDFCPLRDTHSFSP